MSLPINPKFISTDMTTDVELATKLDKQVIDDLFADTKEPTGFINRTSSTLSFNESTRTLSIAPVSGSFYFYIQGVKYQVSTTLEKQIPDTSGPYFFYIDTDLQLKYLTAFDTLLLSDYAYAAYVLWDADDNKAICFGEERHGCQMPSSVHSLLHLTRGTQLLSGGSANYLDDQDGSSNSHMTIGFSDMVIMDEDIRVTLTHSATPTSNHEQILYPTAKIPIFYRSGSIWKKTTATDYPLVTGTTRAKYNLNNAGNWSLVESSQNGKHLVTYIFATTNIHEPVIGLLGQGEYTNVDDAFIRAAWSSINFGDLPAQEMKLLYILIYETNSTFANTPKCAIRMVRDFRYGVDREVSATSSNADHANLSGLLNDDHTQYLTQLRGEALFYTESEVDTFLAGKQATGDYITALTGDVTASGPGSSEATLADSGVTPGTYNIVSVDAKGRVTSGTVGATTRYAYKTTANNAVTSTTYAAVTELTSVSLDPGTYRFRFIGLAQTAATQTGIGFRIAGGTATLNAAYGKFFIKQGTDGTAANYQYDQLTAATNSTSASVQTANGDFVVDGEGVFVVTVAGTVAIQQRTEVNNSAATLRPNAILVIEVV